MATSSNISKSTSNQTVNGNVYTPTNESTAAAAISRYTTPAENTTKSSAPIVNGNVYTPTNETTTADAVEKYTTPTESDVKKGGLTEDKGIVLIQSQLLQIIMIVIQVFLI